MKKKLKKNLLGLGSVLTLASAASLNAQVITIAGSGVITPGTGSSSVDFGDRVVSGSSFTYNGTTITPIVTPPYGSGIRYIDQGASSNTNGEVGYIDFGGNYASDSIGAVFTSYGGYSSSAGDPPIFLFTSAYWSNDPLGTTDGTGLDLGSTTLNIGFTGTINQIGTSQWIGTQTFSTPVVPLGEYLIYTIGGITLPPGQSSGPGSTGVNVNGVAFINQTVPEPSSTALLLVGGGILGASLIARRRTSMV